MAAMVTDPGGFYLYPPAAQVPVPTPVYVEERPQSLPLVQRSSGDAFAMPTAFRPSTDAFLAPNQPPALGNYLARQGLSGSQYAPEVMPVLPAGSPTYGSSVATVVPAGNLRNVDYGRPD